MLPKENRLRKQKDFDRVLKQGKGFKQGLLFLKIVPNGTDVSRFGFVVGKSFSKSAVMRNKAKRILRQIVRKKLPFVKQGMDGAIIAFKGLEKQDFSDMEKTIDILFKKAKILKLR